MLPRLRDSPPHSLLPPIARLYELLMEPLRATFPDILGPMVVKSASPMWHDFASSWTLWAVFPFEYRLLRDATAFHFGYRLLFDVLFSKRRLVCGSEGLRLCSCEMKDGRFREE